MVLTVIGPAHHIVDSQVPVGTSVVDVGPLLYHDSTSQIPSSQCVPFPYSYCFLCCTIYLHVVDSYSSTSLAYPTLLVRHPDVVNSRQTSYIVYAYVHVLSTVDLQL